MFLRPGEEHGAWWGREAALPAEVWLEQRQRTFPREVPLVEGTLS